MKQIRLELSMSKQVSAAHPSATQVAKLIVLMGAAINAVVKGGIDDPLELRRDSNDADGSNQMDSRGARDRRGG